jgi:prophage regulatory protein
MRLLERKALKTEKGINYSDTQIWRLEKENRFPKSIRIGGGRKAWIEGEIDEYIAQRIAARDQVVA